MLKEDVKHPWFTGRVFTSAGIGRGYILGNRTRNKFCGKDTDDRYQAANGQMMAMPKYYKNILYRDWETDRKSTRLNSSHITRSRMPSSA